MNEYEVIIENSTDNIKKKITEIKKIDRKAFIQNYYSNCEDSDIIYVIYAEKTVVFWNDDNGVIRVYFGSCSVDELIEVLKRVPANSCLEYITKSEDSFNEIAKAAEFEPEFTMLRYVQKALTDEELESIRKYWTTIKKALYIPQLAYVATRDDLEDVYQKLFEIFDNRESHICTRKELGEYIDNGWVIVARDTETKILNGIEIFIIEPGFRRYGYQLWSGDGSITLANLQIVGDEALENYKTKLEEESGRKIIPKPSYGWINKKNKAAIRNTEKGGLYFDGLYDYGFMKK